MDRPDILIFMSDQHNGSYMGCAGHPVVETPYMDELARRGTRFTDTYTSCPLCVPARMSLMTAQLPQKTEIYGNSDALRSDLTTIPYCMGAVGYETSLIGRMHFVGEDQRHGFEHRMVGDFNPTWGRGGTKRADLGPYVLTPVDDITRLVGGGTSPVLEYDREVVQAALEYLGEEHERPQFTVVGTFGPHHPFVAPEELYLRYRGRTDDPKDLGRTPDYTSTIAGKHHADISEQDMREIRAAYFGMITQIDRHLGAVYEAWQAQLARSGRKGIFIYLSDHGEMAGEHGLYRKELFYEGSVHIPLILCGEGIPQGKIIERPVSIMDLGPTLCELLGAPRMPQADGRSLVPLLRDVDGDPDRPIFSQMLYAGIPGIMVRRRQYKFITYYGLESEDLLFDLAQDPLELHNAAPENPQLCESLRGMAAQVWDGERALAIRDKWREHHKVLDQWGGVSPAKQTDFWIVPEKARQIPTVR